MKKKLFACILAVALSLSAFGCGGYAPDESFVPIVPGELPQPTVSRDDPTFRDVYGTLTPYEEEVTVKVAAISYELESGVKSGTTPINQSFNKIAKQYLNINLQYSVVAASTAYDNKINLAIAAEEMPDMFYTTNASLYVDLRDSGELADLSPYFWNLNDELTENYLNDIPEVLPTVMDNGKLYALPMLTNTYHSAQRLYIRKDWLDIVNMSVPTTMDEFIAVGEAFVAHKEEIAAATGVSANQIIPFTMTNKLTWQGSYSIEGFLNCFNTSVGSYFEGEDGELYASNTSPNTKAALKTLNELYEKGILDREFLSKNSEMVQSRLKAGFVGMVFGEWWMPKDALDECITNVEGSDWTWCNIPSAIEGEEAMPVVSRVAVSGYNLVSKKCKNPEAIIKLINLFYDIYYNDSAATKYVDKTNPSVSLTLPSNGFYYQFVPVKLWDGVASAREYKRVQSVFNGLYEKGFYSTKRLTDGLYQEIAISELSADDYQIASSGASKVNIINREIIAEINANSEWKALFDQMRNREKILHFADGYPYFVAYKQGVNIKDMSAQEKRGWGIYHEMIDENGSYAYVVELTEGTEKARYNEFYGAALSMMNSFGEYLNTQADTSFTRIITGERNIDFFDTFVATFNKNGGPKIIKQVNAWYDAQPKNQTD